MTFLLLLSLIAAPADTALPGSAPDSATTAPIATDSVIRPIQRPVRTRESSAMDSGTALTMSQALDRMIAGNRDLRNARLQWLSRRQSRLAAWGIFEPKLVGSYNDKSQGRTDNLVPKDLRNSKFSLQGSLPTGTQWDLGYQHDAYENAPSTYISQVTSSITLKQPVLRGFWYGAPTAAIRTAKAELSKSFHSYRSLLMDVFSKMQTAFWDARVAEELLASESQSVQTARDLLMDGAQRGSRGLISPLDLEKLASELASRMARRMDAERQLQESRKRLSFLLGDSALGSAPKLSPRPIEDLDTDAVALDPASLDTLLHRHPAWSTQQGEIDRLQADLDSHRSQRLPKFDVSGSFGWSAQSRLDAVAVQKFRDPGLRDGFLAGGFELEIPIFGNFAESHQVRAAELSVRAATVQRNQNALQLRGDALELARRADLFRASARELGSSVTYRQRALESEIRKIQAGKSNYQLLYDIEEKLRDARRQELEMIRSYRISRVELGRSTGLLLTNLGLETVGPEGDPILREDLVAGEP